MSDNIKFTEEEMKELKEHQDAVSNIILQFGQLEIEKMLIEKRKEELENLRKSLETKFSENTEKEKVLASKLSDKYGPGVLDPSTGIFTPQPAQAQTKPGIEEVK